MATIEEYDEAGLSSDEGEHLADLLQKISRKIKRKYLNQNKRKEDKKDAALLQSFFHALKIISMKNEVEKNSSSLLYKGYSIQTLLELKYKTTDVLDNIVSQDQLLEIYNQVQSIVGSKAAGQLFLNREWLTRGEQLEQDLGNIGIAIAQLVGDELAKTYGDEISKLFVTGKETAATGRGLSPNVDKNLIQKFRDAIGDKTTTDELGKKQIKTDVDFTNLNIMLESAIDSKWYPILRLLSQCTITAKNYASRSYQDVRFAGVSGSAVWKNNDRSEITIGHTASFKVLNAVLDSLGINLSKKQSNKFLYGMTQVLADKKPANLYDIVQDTYHQITALYELRGAGQLGVNEARFLIYNDPTGDDFKVVPTIELLADYFDSDIDAGSGNTITKSRIRELAGN